ncbi:ectoine utilization protein EutC [Sneathiella sp.]|uniref:ectoine utilization protein EutC n=1 Tax=Sneathiella sp. TaxID=1964365 RepID=UPI00356AF030
MPDIKILTESELRRVVSLDAPLIDCIESAFKSLATADVAMPPIMSLHIPEHNGEVDVKTAYVPGVPSFAIKMSPGFFDNPKIGLPSLNGLMVVFSAKTGLVEALFLDNGYLTDIRTAAAGAVAARWLSRQDSKSVGIIGSGLQARLQLKAVTLVRDIEKAVIWGRDSDRALQCAEDCRESMGIDVSTTDNIDDLMSGCDIIVTTTPSPSPLVFAGQLRPGQHITAMGSDAEYKNELAPDVLAVADRYVCDSLAQCLKQGELRSAVAAGRFTEDAEFTELGAVIAGQKSGRRSIRDITICDLTGTGVQDTAIATLAYQRSNLADVGSIFSS